VTIEERARRYIATMPEAISGQHGHDRMFSVACTLVRGFSLKMPNARVLLAEYNATLTDPFTDKEMEHKLKDAAKTQSARGNGYLLDLTDKPIRVRINPKKPAGTPHPIIQLVTFGTGGTGISYEIEKNDTPEDINISGEFKTAVPPVPRRLRGGGGKPTLSATGVLRIPMNAPIQYRYWLKGTSLAPVGTKFLSPQETREALFRVS